MTDALTCSSNMPACKTEKCISLAFEKIVLKVTAEQNDMRHLRFHLHITGNTKRKIYTNAGYMHSDKQSVWRVSVSRNSSVRNENALFIYYPHVTFLSVEHIRGIFKEYKKKKSE